MKLSGVVVALCFLSIVSGKERCCDEMLGCFTNDYPFDNMPLPDCLNRINPTMTMYTRQNPDQGEPATRDTIPTMWSPNRRTLVLTHGYTQGGNTNWLHNMKNTALQHYDYNVMIVGWFGGSFEIWYPQAASNTRIVGAEIGNVINNMINKGGASAADFWCAGHSLGSHVCGHIGNLKVKIGRITGLDPAGPWFENKDWKVGLNPDSADFVDAWHTHGDPNFILNTGTLKPLGDVDYYPNGGVQQPGCILDPYTGDNHEEHHIQTRGGGDWMPVCSHLRVLDLFTESLDPSCKFYTRHMCWDAYNIPDACIPCRANNEPCHVMGPEAETYGIAEGYLYLETNKKAPFCKG